jgi:hypothetical protein
MTIAETLLPEFDFGMPATRRLLGVAVPGIYGPSADER